MLKGKEKKEKKKGKEKEEKADKKKDKKKSKHEVTKEELCFGAPMIEKSEIRLIEKKGQGCFGTVWGGKCRGANVAVKIPNENRKISPEALEEFSREIELMSKIFSPNINLFMGACLDPENIMIGKCEGGRDIEFPYLFRGSSVFENLSPIPLLSLVRGFFESLLIVFLSLLFYFCSNGTHVWKRGTASSFEDPVESYCPHEDGERCCPRNGLAAWFQSDNHPSRFEVIQSIIYREGGSIHNQSMRFWSLSILCEGRNVERYGSSIWFTALDGARGDGAG